MSCLDVVRSPERSVRPILYSVPVEDLDVARATLAAPEVLLDVWDRAGYGFFAEDPAGNRLTEATNLFLSPDQVTKLKGSFASYESDPFKHGIPFFNTLDREYLLITLDGSIAYAGLDEPIVVAASLEEFLDALMDNPEFYDRLISDASPSN